MGKWLYFGGTSPKLFSLCSNKSLPCFILSYYHTLEMLKRQRSLVTSQRGLLRQQNCCFFLNYIPLTNTHFDVTLLTFRFHYTDFVKTCCVASVSCILDKINQLNMFPRACSCHRLLTHATQHVGQLYTT